MSSGWPPNPSSSSSSPVPSVTTDHMPIASNLHVKNTLFRYAPHGAFHSLLHLHAVTVVNEFMCEAMDDAGMEKDTSRI